MNARYYSRDLILVGGGHSHCLVLRMLAMRPVPGLRITLLSLDSHTPYSGMLPGLVAGHYSFEETHIDLEALAFWAGARFIRARVMGLDPEKKHLYLDGNQADISYDAVSFDIGSVPDSSGVDGVEEHAVPVKPVSSFYSRWLALEAKVSAQKDQKTIAVVGGGAGSVELILAMRHRFSMHKIKLCLLAASSELLGGYGKYARNAISSELIKQGIEVYTQFRVSKVEENCIHSESGQQLSVDDVFWCTGAAAAPWLKACGLGCDDRGFIEVNNSLQSVSHSSVFAAGDIASLRENPRPKAGVYAVRQGPYLAENLRRYFSGHSLKSYSPQENFLSLVSLGDKRATADKSGLSVSGGWVWRWKDHIDRQFMKRFQSLPVMPRLSVDTALVDDMHCGGCGAKLPADMLRRVLASLSNKVTDSLGDDAAILELAADTTLLQSLDVLRELVSDPFVMGRIAANHALSDIYAMGGRPLTALALVSLPYNHLRIQERDMRSLMAGAAFQFEQANCQLAGGHSLEGSELSIGFSVTGDCRHESLLLKSGIADGDKLILCKPLGTGVLYAAQRYAAVDGRWLNEAQHVMLQSNRQAADIAGRYQASACTDVTGFGLLGHLSEMLAGSDLGAELRLDQLPLLSGVAQCIAQSVESTMYDANRWFETQIDNSEIFCSHPHYPALFDPQTSGGLLFSISAKYSADCIEELKEAGYTKAVVIGSARPGNILLT